ncbi:hypothetical protein [Streptomyces sp. NPDC101145]|uniref:hypothetical protein n=1 Tax=Streptomyces sp. NPDC101145 TaxID=3366112 RepID=UPI0037FE0FFC
MKFTDERWQAAQETDWGTPRDSHPHLCDSCKQTALAAERHAVAEQEHQEPGRRGTAPHSFLRYARRPDCTECGAAFTDERWQAVEHAGWGTPPEPRPSLCGDCDRWYVSNAQQAWSDEHRHEEQDQAVPEQKTTGWFSRLRR